MGIMISKLRIRKANAYHNVFIILLCLSLNLKLDQNKQHFLDDRYLLKQGAVMSKPHEAIPARRLFLKKSLTLIPLAAAAGTGVVSLTTTAQASPAKSPGVSQHYVPVYFNNEEWAFLLAACERLIPTDANGPGAVSQESPFLLINRWKPPSGMVACGICIPLCFCGTRTGISVQIGSSQGLSFRHWRSERLLPAKVSTSFCRVKAGATGSSAI